MAPLGFPNNICKANGIVAVKLLLQRKLKAQKGRNFTHVWEWLWREQIHPKEGAEKNPAGIGDSMKRGHSGWLRMDFLALKNSVGFNYFHQVWGAFVAFPDRALPDYLPLNFYNTDCPATHGTLITHWIVMCVCVCVCIKCALSQKETSFLNFKAI